VPSFDARRPLERIAVRLPDDSMRAAPMSRTRRTATRKLTGLAKSATGIRGDEVVPRWRCAAPRSPHHTDLKIAAGKADAVDMAKGWR
jgi:hypothetical protein